MCSIGIIVSHPNANCPGDLSSVMWDIEPTEDVYATRITLYGSSLSTYFLSCLNVLMAFESTWWIYFMINLTWGLPVISGLEWMPYSFWIKLF